MKHSGAVADDRVLLEVVRRDCIPLDGDEDHVHPQNLLEVWHHATSVPLQRLKHDWAGAGDRVPLDSVRYAKSVKRGLALGGRHVGDNRARMHVRAGLMNAWLCYVVNMPG